MNHDFIIKTTSGEIDLSNVSKRDGETLGILTTSDYIDDYAQAKLTAGNGIRLGSGLVSGKQSVRIELEVDSNSFIFSNGALSLSAGKGIKIENGTIKSDYSAGDYITIDENGKINCNISVGDGLLMDSTGKITLVDQPSGGGQPSGDGLTRDEVLDMINTALRNLNYVSSVVYSENIHELSYKTSDGSTHLIAKTEPESYS